LRRAVELFRSIGDRGGEHAALSFLGLVHPDDPEVANWLENSLRYAEETGDRSRQVASLIPLAWHHYIRARLGGEQQIATALRHATQLRDLAAEVGGLEWEAHGACIAAHLARLAGHIAPDETTRLRHYLADPNPRVAALSKATLFALQIAVGGTDPAPQPITDSPDPVIGVAELIVFEALTLAGRVAEARNRVGRDTFTPRLDSVEALMPGLSITLADVLAGALDGSQPRLEAAIATADALASAPAAATARALLAEVIVRTHGDVDLARVLVDDAATLDAGGIAAALVMRAAALLGDDAAALSLDREVQRLRAPGLALSADMRLST
jgi:hypothetical protein